MLTSSEMTLIERAKLFATAAHGALGQKRKFSGDPYIVHPEKVASIISENVDDATPEMIAAAWLHDVVEDTEILNRDIETFFGYTVSRLVYEVTNFSKKTGGNRAERKKLDREHLSKASDQGKTIKLADIIANCGDLDSAESSFSRMYINEKRDLLPYLKDGNHKLYDLAEKIIFSATAKF